MLIEDLVLGFIIGFLAYPFIIEKLIPKILGIWRGKQ